MSRVFSVTIPEGLYRELKKACIDENLYLKGGVKKAIELWLKEKGKEEGTTDIKKITEPRLVRKQLHKEIKL